MSAPLNIGMSISVTYRSTPYSVPVDLERGWGPNVTALLLALAGSEAATQSLTNKTLTTTQFAGTVNFTGATVIGLGSGTGTVTSVSLTAPAEISVAGSPVTTSGTLALTWAAQTGNVVFASPSGGGSGTPAFRVLVAADIPALDTAKLTTGTLAAARMPALTGDITTSAGAVATTLATVNANVGTFTALTVNGKGLVTAAVNQTFTGDATGTASGSSTALTLATVNGNVGTFQGLTVSAKGLVTAAANQSYLTANQSITLSGDATGTGTTAITVVLATVGSAASGNWITTNVKGLATATVTKNAIMHLCLVNPVNGTYFLSLAMPRGGTINSARCQTDVGTCTANVLINTTSVTSLSAVSVTSTAGTTNATGANTFVATDIIKITISAVASAPTQLNITLNITPT